MTFLYRLSLQAYVAAVRIAALRNEKAKKWLSGRMEVWERLKELDTTNGTIWFHCSSLGEFEQGRPLIEKLKAEYPQFPIVLTFFSPSGYEIRKEYAFADKVVYLPVDSPKNAQRLVSLLRPVLAVFVKYDYWYYYFRELYSHEVPLLMLSSIFRSSQPFFRFYGALHRQMLKSVNHFFVQDEQSKELLLRRGFSNATVIPDTRIDRVYQISQTVKAFPEIESWIGEGQVLIGGSTYQKEEEMIARLLGDKLWKGKVIIAPHKVCEESLAQVESRFKQPAIRYSRLKEEPETQSTILLIDNVGMLSSLYKMAAIAFIGGGFGKSIHNILEPAAFGLPIFFGPNHHKFHEAKAMIAAGGAFEINNYEQLREQIAWLMEDKNRETAGAASADFILKNTGGTDMVMGYIGKHVDFRLKENGHKGTKTQSTGL